MRKIGALIMGSMLIYLPMLAQVSLTGPACVFPGVVYEYRIKGNWDSTSTMQVCVSGGLLRNGDGSGQGCTAPGGKPMDVVQIVWNGSGTIKMTSSKGNVAYAVNATSAFRPGTIVAASQTQTIPRRGIPATISCNPDSGGSCQPRYSYQWQQSMDRVSWVDVPGATGAALHFAGPSSKSLFYRRKVMETASGNTGYSDVASVFVGIGDYSDSTSINPLH